MSSKELNWQKERSLPGALRHAGRGLFLAFKSQINIRRQLFCFLGACILAGILKLSLWHFSLIVLVSIFVLALEVINTAFEALADAIHPEYNDLVRSAKDISAGAVLLASLMSVIMALLIFLPPIIDLVI